MGAQLTEEQLAAEAAYWLDRTKNLTRWVTVPVSEPDPEFPLEPNVYLPPRLLSILQEFAVREGLCYQTLLKKWLDEKVRQEAERMGLRAVKGEEALVTGAPSRLVPNYYAPMPTEVEGKPRPYEHGLEGLDPECQQLAEALNDIEGVRTIGCCSGHGERPLFVSFLARDLMVLGQVMKLLGSLGEFNRQWHLEAARSLNCVWIKGLVGSNGDKLAEAIRAEIKRQEERQADWERCYRV